ncbi:MAG: alanine--tRNA ligase [Actinobacteria bacterium]|nr:alanine--tRNA ligase [Actinomycetota bacterium]
MESAEIRSRWLRFFESDNRQGLTHTVVPSASLIADDPNLLLVNAGMVPFKPYFLGEITPPYKRATSVQKCVRTLDIDEVGKTTRHASFFQMCGNFSFGDYFKEGAIALAWELLTRPINDGGYGFPEDRLWVTVYLDDDEAADIWHTKMGVPKDRIQRRDMQDNFWSMGIPGPCGPCSEIYFDRGPAYGAEGGPIADENRYMEVWNLVFMQNERGVGSGKNDYPILGELPAKSIDTGLGLERMAALLQGVENIYEIDTTMQILTKASELTGVKYGSSEKTDVSLRIIADHARTSAMLIGDGVTPGNEGRGYVLRRMMRRTIRNMRLLGSMDPIMSELTVAAIGAMGPQYPELVNDTKRILSVSVSEEESFLQTLKSGTQIFDVASAALKKSKSSVLPGEDAFKLHDTYGFPFDLTLEMAREEGLEVDEDGFRRLMKEQKDRAKADSKAKKSGHTDLSVYRQVADKNGKSEFIGYSHLTSEAKVTAVLVDGNLVGSAGADEEVEIILVEASKPQFEKLEEVYSELGNVKSIRPGYANTTLIAIAPTKSSSFIHGQVSMGIEPIKSNYFIKDLAKSKTVYKNPFLETELEKYNLNTSETWESILKKDGSVQHLDFPTKKVFKSFIEISPKEIIIQAAARQKYIDQSQSLNLMIHPSIPAKDINQLYLFAHEQGIKTLYYQFSMSSAQSFARNILECESCEG